jgi:hypothetical protein
MAIYHELWSYIMSYDQISWAMIMIIAHDIRS